MLTLNFGNEKGAIVKTPDGLFHRVVVGMQIGQNKGVITDITHDRIEIMEIVRGEAGGLIERPAYLTLAK